MAADRTSMLRALANRTRRRPVRALIEKDLGGIALGEQIGISPHNASKHLRVLKKAGIVDVRAKVQRREYFIAAVFRNRLHRGVPCSTSAAAASA